MSKHRECLMRYTGNFQYVGVERLDWELEEIEDESTYFFSVDGVEIGSISVYTENCRINIFNVYLEPSYRGQGFAKEMLSEVLHDLPADIEIVLQVADDNHPAYELYLACGFEVIDSVEVDDEET